MPNWSRRRALQAAAATATAALAGCNAGTERTREAPRGREGDPVTDYESETVRDTEGRPLFWRDDTDGRERGSLTLLADPLPESDVTISEDVPAAETLRAFAADTDFEAESVLLFATRVSGCHAVTLEGVRRKQQTADGGVSDVDVSLCRVYRPADVACERTADHTAGLAVRLPFPADGANGAGASVSSTCRRRPDPVTLGGDDE